MPKPLIGILIAIGVIIAGGAIYLLTSSPSQEASSTTTTSQASQATPEPTTTTTTEPGKYIDYSADAVAAATGIRLLFFHAPWCPQCRALDANITSSTVPEGVTIFKVDYDSQQSLRQQYGVTIQTTVVAIDVSGNLLKRYVAYDTPTLVAVLENTR